MMDYAELPLTVLKFGGTSVAGPERMRHVARLVKKVRDSGYRVAVVVSAMGNMTDDLLALAKDVANTENGREMDQLLATGEQQSVALLALALQKSGLAAQSFTAPGGHKSQRIPDGGPDIQHRAPERRKSPQRRRCGSDHRFSGHYRQRGRHNPRKGGL